MADPAVDLAWDETGYSNPVKSREHHTVRAQTEQEMANAIEVTDDTFATKIEGSDGLAVVDFWATWCAPCRMIAPIVEQLAGDYAGKATVAKLDVDSNPRTAARFNVRSIPTILFFKGGKLVDQVVGAVPRPQLEAKFKEHA
jgi:thioredoxin 1